MKKLLTLFLIFCFYTQSISSVTQGNYFIYAFSIEGEEEDNEPSKREQEQAERLAAQLDEACSNDDGTCDYTYNGMGANEGDKSKVFWEQAILMTIAFLSAAKLTKCLRIKAKWFAFNKTAKDKIKCLGWGEVAEIAAFTAIVTGEILQTVMVNKAVKKELDKRENYLESDESVDDEINLKKVLSGEAKIENITGDLGALNDECRAENNLTEEERIEKCHNSSQIRPLRALKRILEKQLLTTKIKNTIYITAASALSLVMVTDIIAAIKQRTVDSAVLAKNSAICSAALAATATGIAAACTTACTTFMASCPVFEVKKEASEGVPLGSCTHGVILAPLNQSCGASSLAVAANCGDVTAVGHEVESMVNATYGDYASTCVQPNIVYSDVILKDFDFGVVFDFLVNRVFSNKINDNNKIKGSALKLIASIALQLFGGFLGYLFHTKVMSKNLDRWAFSNAKRAVMHGAQAGMIGVNIAFTTQLKNRLETEIAELDHYMTKIDASISNPDMAMGVDRLVPDQEVGRDFESQFKQEFDDAFGREKSPCPKGADGKGGCLKIQPMMSQVVGGLGLDGLVGQTSNDVAKYADLMANKNKLDSNALKLGQKIAAAKGPLDKLKKKLMKKYNAMRVKDGNKPINFEKLSANLLQTLKDKFYEATGQTANASVASLDKKAKKEKPVANAKKKLAAAEKKEGKAGADANGFSFNFQKQKEEGISDGNVVDDTDADQYTVGDADITKGTSKDIFKVITTRYFKSAYPVLVEELK